MKQETKSFISFGAAKPGIVFNDSYHPLYPITYHNVINELPELNKGNSFFGYVYSGDATLTTSRGLTAQLNKNSYFSLSDGSFALSGAFKCALIEIFTDRGLYGKTRYNAYDTIGGPIEATGRLKYIDGCTDSLLIPPVKKGDPCLNHLHFPTDIIQTAHTHPSHRLGLVVNGRGQCVTPFGNLPLEEGILFVIKEYDGKEKAAGLDGGLYEAGTHKFDTQDSVMDVIAFHPDSDFGAEDENHPMINRTIVAGVSAKDIDNIKTK